MRKNYRKHFVIIEDTKIKVKDWMRQNPNYFTKIKGVPTTNQIGKVLDSFGFNVCENYSVVIYL